MTLQSKIISRVVRSSLESDMLSILAIINKISSPRKIARRLLPEIKKRLGHEPKLDSVSKAVERYVNSVQESGNIGRMNIDDLRDALSKTQVSVRSDVAIISVRLSKGIEKKLIKLIEYIYSRGTDPFITITYGKSHVTILFDQLFFERVEKIVGKKILYILKKTMLH